MVFSFNAWGIEYKSSKVSIHHMDENLLGVKCTIWLCYFRNIVNGRNHFGKVYKTNGWIIY